MKFTCEKELLLKEMLIAHDTISTKSSISILSNVLFTVEKGKLKILATDLKVAFSSSISVQTKTPGTIVVFCDRLMEILRSLPDGEIDFTLDENQVLSITPATTKANFKLKCIPADKFPVQPEIEDNLFSDFPQKDFIDMIVKTIYAISDDETRFFLNGVFLEKTDSRFNMVASDGRRLALIAKDNAGFKGAVSGVIIPPKILNIVRKNASGEGNLSFAITDKSIFIKLENRLFSSTLIEGKFPNYQKIIPEKNECQVKVKRRALEESLKRVAILIENKTRSVILQFNKNTLTISSEESEIGKAQEEIPCEYSGQEQVLTFNYYYILEPLRVIDTDMVEIDFNDAKHAVILKPVGEARYFNIIMPLQSE
jgi:DNA polymerase III subunit beta